MINSVTTSTYATTAAKTNNTSTEESVASTAEKTTATKTATKTSKTDTYEKSNNTEYDKASVQAALKASEEAKTASFQKLLNSMLKTQYKKYSQSMPSSNIGSYFANLEVDPQTRAQAQADIAEDGYWGVKQTAGRILDFAKAIAGDDIDKLNEMKDAVNKGFKQAEQMWGGSLPGISGQTYDRVMQGFDEWEKSIAGSASVAE